VYITVRLQPNVDVYHFACDIRTSLVLSLLQSIERAAECLKNIALNTGRQQFIHYTRAGHLLPQPLLTSLPLLLEHDIKQSISTTFKLKLANTNVHRYLQCYTHGPQSQWI